MIDDAGADDGNGASDDSSGSDEENQGGGKQDKDVVPKSQFLAAIRSGNEKYERLAAELAELKANKNKSQEAETPQKFTSAQLNAAVAAGQITADQKDEILTRQIREEVTAEVTRSVLNTVGSSETQRRVDSDLSEYKRLAPEIMDTSSETRGKVADAYRQMIGDGLPQGLATELAAIRVVLGPLEKLKVARSARNGSEYHEETGGGDSGQGQRREKSAFDSLTPREKDYYTKMIEKGMYKDMKEVKEVLKHKRVSA